MSQYHFSTAGTPPALPASTSANHINKDGQVLSTPTPVVPPRASANTAFDKKIPPAGVVGVGDADEADLAGIGPPLLLRKRTLVLEQAGLGRYRGALVEQGLDPNLQNLGGFTNERLAEIGACVN